MSITLLRPLAAAALMLGLVAPAQASTTPDKLDGVKIVSAEQAREMQSKGAVLVDTRVAAENAEKTIKGSLSVPYKEKSAKEAGFDRAQDKFELAKLPPAKDASVVMFCNGAECWKSYKGAVLARDAGYKQVYWLRGGLPEWVAKGLPTQ
jgi:rhodanese-related sulfurtransferase